MAEEKEFHLTYGTATALWSDVPGDLSNLPRELESMAVDQECIVTAVLESRDPEGYIIGRRITRVNDALGDKRGNYKLTIISEKGYSRLKVIRKA